MFGGNLSNWDPGMLLLLGQEDNIGGGTQAKAARDFRGEFHLVAIFSRALNAQEVNRNFRAGPVACVGVGEVQHIPDFSVNLASVDVPTVVPVTVGIPSPADGIG